MIRSALWAFHFFFPPFFFLCLLQFILPQLSHMLLQEDISALQSFRSFFFLSFIPPPFILLIVFTGILNPKKVNKLSVVSVSSSCHSVYWNAAQLALSINLISLFFILWCFSPRFWTRSSVISPLKKKKKTGRNCSLELIVCIVKNLNFKKGYLDISVFFEEKLRSSWFFGMDVN